MRDAIERITNKGNSFILLQLAERVANTLDRNNAQPIPSDTVSQRSVNVMGLSSVNRAITSSQRTVLLINTVKDFFKVNTNVKTIEMQSGLCNDPQIQRWNLGVFSRLTELTVGDNCLQYVQELKLAGLGMLESVSFGSHCFTASLGRFEVSGCAKLKNVVMGEGCCVNWSEFVMKDCEVAEEVSIGNGCFVNCESVVFESWSLIEM